MEDNRFNTRRNVMKLSTVPAFTSVKGGYNHKIKDVYFIRCIGYNDHYTDEIQAMDQFLTLNESNGAGRYIRWNSMPRLSDYDQIEFYTNTYMTWVNNQRKDIATKYVQNGMPVAEVLNTSLQKAELLFIDYAVSYTETIQKNYMIKLLYWIDTLAGEWLINWNPKSSYKIVSYGEVKQQEYLFLYLLTTLGFDVMLMNPVSELNIDSKLLELSDCIEFEQKGRLPLAPLDKQKILNGSRNQEQMFNQGNTANQGNALNQENMPSQANSANQGNTPNQDNTSNQGRSNSGPESTNQPPIISSDSLKHPNREHYPQSNDQEQTKTQGHEPNQGQAAAQGQGRAKSHMQPQESIQAVAQEQDRIQSGPQGSPQPTHQGQGNSQSLHQMPNRPQPVNQSTNRSIIEGERSELSFEELAQLASSVVMIAIHDKKGDVFATGSGIMINEKGYILTNNHVASGGYGYSVRIEDDDKIYHTDEVIKYNNVLDLALIRIDRRCKPLPIYHNGKDLVRGQKVVAIGSPLGLFNSVSNGIISGFRKLDDVDMVQFTAPISHGSSGGAVLNMYGEVIGISTAGFDDGQNINLAVDYKWIQGFLRGFI